ncbi:MAG: tellurite resistance TerB family protein [Pseudomonadota bacterium]
MSFEDFGAQDALVAVMIAMAAADETITDSELEWISNIVYTLPVFRSFDPERIRPVSSVVAGFLSEEDGLDALISLVSDRLPDHLRETAYALACDVAAADGKVVMSELKLLEMLRYDLAVGRLAAAAIERGARARHMRLDLSRESDT